MAAGCPSCGARVEPGAHFCGSCGCALTTRAVAAATPAPAIAERRVCSVLFCDLVGFTHLSASRDPEEARELLSRYFDAARTVIGRYGGTVEKFIGDAVMAVWGAPTAAEGDAERAVRAALDVVAAVAALGEAVHAPGLAARAGVVTGEVAVTLGAAGQGMVAGDAVNTASRVQAAASAGGVLVDEATRRLTATAISFDDAGEHALKGKAEPERLWRATRILAGVGGAQRVDGLEAPLTGRDPDSAYKPARRSSAGGLSFSAATRTDASISPACAGSRRHRAGAAARSCTQGRRSSRSAARSSPPFARARRSP